MSRKKRMMDSVSCQDRKSKSMISEYERARIRKYRAEGIGIREISRRTGINRNTVRRWLRQESPAPRKRSAAGDYLASHKEAVLKLFLKCELNCVVLRRVLREEFGVDVSLRTLQRFCEPYRKEIKRKKAVDEVPERFETAPGVQMQIDFGEREILINGEPVKVHVFVAILGYSRRVFCKVYPAETQVAWLDGVECAFSHFGGVPCEIVSDNAKCLVRNPAATNPAARFTERYFSFCNYYSIKPVATGVAQPQSKGKIERAVRYVKSNALVYVDKPSIEDWNIYLENWCRDSDSRNLTTVFEGPYTPEDRFLLEEPKLRKCDLPRIANFKSETRKVAKDGLIRVDNMYYPLPHSLIGMEVQILTDANTVTVSRAGEEVAVLDKAAGVFKPNPQTVSTVSSEEAAYRRLSKDPQWQQYQSSVNPLQRDGSVYDRAIGWASRSAS